jgi:hypothetical protein
MKLLETVELEIMVSGINFSHMSGSRRTSRLSGAIQIVLLGGEKAQAQVSVSSTSFEGKNIRPN